MSLRTVIGEDGNPWFVAKDVADALGYADTVKAVKAHCKAYRPVGGGRNALPLDPQTNIIPERDIYRLVMRSKLPSAERFEDWVVSEVLPAIRKTGKYEAKRFKKWVTSEVLPANAMQQHCKGAAKHRPQSSTALSRRGASR